MLENRAQTNSEEEHIMKKKIISTLLLSVITITFIGNATVFAAGQPHPSYYNEQHETENLNPRLRLTKPLVTDPHENNESDNRP